MPKKASSIFLKIVGIICILFSIFQFLLFMWGVAWGGFVISFFSIFYLIVLVGFLMGGIEIMRRKRWGRFMIIILSIIHFIIYMYMTVQAFNGYRGPGFWPETIGFLGPGIVFPLFFFFSLIGNKIRKQFK